MNQPSFTWQAADWPAFVGHAWPKELMHARLTDRLHVKQGRSIARWTLGLGDIQLHAFVKRHFEHSRLRSILARLWPWRQWSDAGREWHHLEAVAALGVPTPRPLAVAEWHGAGGSLQSALVLEELPDMAPLHEAISLAAKQLSPREFASWKRGLIAELARLTLLMHDRGWFHQDLYLCHFYVRRSDVLNSGIVWRDRVALIDFHRLARPPLLSLFARAKDLGQLLYSANLPSVSMRDIATFWRLYRRGREPILRRLIAWKARRYQRHNEKRRR